MKNIQFIKTNPNWCRPFVKFFREGDTFYRRNTHGGEHYIERLVATHEFWAAAYRLGTAKDGTYVLLVHAYPHTHKDFAKAVVKDVVTALTNKEPWGLSFPWLKDQLGACACR